MTNSGDERRARVRGMGESSGREDGREALLPFIERGRGEDESARERERWPAVNGAPSDFMYCQCVGYPREE
jgi:hypothetical protein